MMTMIGRDVSLDEIGSVGHFRKSGLSILILIFLVGLSYEAVCCEVRSVMEVGSGGLKRSLRNPRGLQ